MQHFFLFLSQSQYKEAKRKEKIGLRGLWLSHYLSLSSCHLTCDFPVLGRCGTKSPIFTLFGSRPFWFYAFIFSVSVPFTLYLLMVTLSVYVIDSWLIVFHALWLAVIWARVANIFEALQHIYYSERARGPKLTTSSISVPFLCVCLQAHCLSECMVPKH